MAGNGFIEMTGKTFGKLTVIERDLKTVSQIARWICECECGTVKSVLGTSLRNGKSKSCGCSGGVTSSGEQAHKRMYRALQSGARSRKLDCEISYDEFVELTKKKCFICGSAPTDKRYAYSRKRYSQGIDKDEFLVFNGVDRVNSKLGYVKGNVEACCTMCNRMKSDFTLVDFYAKVRMIENYQKEK